MDMEYVGGSPERHKKVIVPSGWTIDPEEKIGRGEHKNGDLELHYGQISLHVRNLGNIRQFEHLVPLEELKGLPIEEVILIKGSNGQYHHDDNAEGDLYIVKAGGKVGRFFMKSAFTVSPNFDDIEAEKLLEIGVLSEDEVEDRSTELKKWEVNRAKIEDIKKEKTALQNSLSDVGFIRGRQIHRRIQEVEVELERLQADLKTMKYPPDINYGFLDKRLPAPEAWAGKTIREIHNFQSDEGRKFHEPDPLFIIFSDGTVGTAVSQMDDENLKFDLDGLVEAGLLSSAEVAEAKRVMNEASADYEYLEGKKFRLSEIKQKLTQSGLGMKETMGLVKERDDIERLISEEETSKAVA